MSIPMKAKQRRAPGQGERLYPVLTPADFRQDARDLALDTWHKLIGCLGFGLDEAAALLPQCWRAIHTVMDLQRLVDDGGLDSFFFGKGGLLVAETEEDLRFIRARSFLGLYRE